MGFEDHRAGWFFWTYNLREQGRDEGQSFRNVLEVECSTTCVCGTLYNHKHLIGKVKIDCEAY